MEIILFILFVLLIIVLSGIISGSEAAILSISYTKAKEIATNSTGILEKKANKLLLVKENLQKYITTIVVLNNIVNIVGSIYVGVLASTLFGEIYLGLISGVLTFFIIIFSEIIPKIYGENHSEKISLNIVGTLIFVTSIFSPIIFLLNKISSFFVKGKAGNSISEGEIREMAILGEQEGSINQYESDVINNVFKMDDIDVYDIMVPKTDVITISEDISYIEMIKLAQKTGFTRFPVTDDNGNFIGIINVKDLFKYHGRENKFLVSKITRPIFFVPETMKIFTMQEKFKKEKTHLAAIVNEHGDVTGIITLEDILEELLGDIEDEFDKAETIQIKKIKENQYHLTGNVDLDDLTEKFDIEFEIGDEDLTTLNGFLTYRLERIPKVNSKVKLDKVIFRVIKASKTKVLEVEMILK